MKPHSFEDLEEDILRESLNLGVGRAAAALSELIGLEVEIFFPELHLLPKRQAVDLLSKKFSTTAWAVQQYFHCREDVSLLAGNIFLFLSDGAQDTPLGQMITELSTRESPPLPEIEVAQEVGNIILSACLSGVADMLAMELVGATPQVHRTELRPLLLGIVRHGDYDPVTVNRRRSLADQDLVIHLLLHFETQANAVDGAVMIFLDLITIPFLKQALARIVNQNY